MDQLTTVGIDLVKEVFEVCVLDATGAVLQRRVLRREAFIRWAEQLSPCRVAMEACASSHHWGRWFAARGHTARLIPAEFDAADADAIDVAARQPTMRFVSIRVGEGVSLLTPHRPGLTQSALSAAAQQR